MARGCLDETLQNVLRRHEELGALLASPDLDPKDVPALSREYSELGPIAEKISALLKSRDELAEKKTA